MKLLTKEIEKKLPSLATVENQSMEELVAIVKFFHPFASWKWFVFGGGQIEGGDYLFYGMVFNPDCPEGELGFFTLSQLLALEIPFGPTVFKTERDKLFKPTPALQITY